MKIDIQPPQRKNTRSLQDGRKLCWYLGFGFSHLERLNLRLIALDRSGLGESSIDPHKTLQS